MLHWSTAVRLLRYRLLLGRGQLPKKVISGEGILWLPRKSAFVLKKESGWHYQSHYIRMMVAFSGQGGFIQHPVVSWRTRFPACLLFCHLSVWLFLLGWLLPWLQEAHADILVILPEKRRIGHFLWTFLKMRNIFRSSCRLPLIFTDQNWVTCPFLNHPIWRRMQLPRSGLNSSKFFLLGETSGWGVGSIQVPLRHMASWQPEQREGFFYKIGLLGRPSDLILMSVGCKIRKGQKSSAETHAHLDGYPGYRMLCVQWASLPKAWLLKARVINWVLTLYLTKTAGAWLKNMFRATNYFHFLQHNILPCTAYLTLLCTEVCQINLHFNIE